MHGVPKKVYSGKILSTLYHLYCIYILYVCLCTIIEGDLQSMVRA